MAGLYLGGDLGFERLACQGLSNNSNKNKSSNNNNNKNHQNSNNINKKMRIRIILLIVVILIGSGWAAGLAGFLRRASKVMGGLSSDRLVLKSLYSHGNRYHRILK